MEIRSSRTYELCFYEGWGGEDTFVNEIKQSFDYLDIDHGSINSFEYSFSVPQVTPITYVFDGTMSCGLYGGGGTYPCHFSDQHFSLSESIAEFSFAGSSISCEVITNTYSQDINLTSNHGELLDSTSRYEKVTDIPANSWRLLDDSVLCYLKLNGYNGHYLIFTELRSNLNFFMDISQTLKNLGIEESFYIERNMFNVYNLRDVLTDNNGKKYVLTCTHICNVSGYYIILRSYFNPEVLHSSLN